MKTSVVVIAHNEEEWIERCLSSLMKQTKTPDEIILLAHNCTDKTEEITRNYNVKIISYNGPKGIIYARLEWLRHVTGDIILCTDGDSFVEKNWVEEMSRLLIEGNILVGSWVKFKGTFFGWISNIFNWYFVSDQKRLSGGFGELVLVFGIKTKN